MRLSSDVCCFLRTFKTLVIYVVPNNRDATIKSTQNKMCFVCLYREACVLRISIYVFLENGRNVYKPSGMSNSDHFLNRCSLSAGPQPHLCLLCFVQAIVLTIL